MVFDGGIKNSNHRSGNKERPAEQSKQLNGCLHPIQFKDIRTHVAYHCKEISYCFVNGFIEPLEHGIPNGIGYLPSEKVKDTADGVTDTANNIS